MEYGSPGSSALKIKKSDCPSRIFSKFGIVKYREKTKKGSLYP